MKILVALDDSPFSRTITTRLIEQLKPAGTEVRLLHVIEPPPIKAEEAAAAPQYPEFMAARRQLREHADRLLREAAARLREAGIHATDVVQEGDPRTAILDEAESWKPDLIVMGSHGRTGVRRWLMGSVSEAVARHAACSVQIVRPPAN
jgi:nucleotide-binding universal stress UspA family protein